MNANGILPATSPAGNSPTQEFNIPLSARLDFALAMEDYHRDGLLTWRQIRTKLEQQIQQPIDELSEVAEQAFQNGHNDPTN